MGSFAKTLQHRISIQKRTIGSGPEGEKIDDWAEYATTRADIRTGNGLEAIRAGASISKVQASIRLRYRTDLNAGMRVVHGTDIYNVLAVLPDKVQRRHIDLACEVVS